MGQAVLTGNPPIEINLRRSGRARRISLRISRLDGRVTLTLPPRVPEREAMAFASEKESWIRKALAAQPVREEVGPGTVLPFAGTTLRLQAARVRAARADGDTLLVPQGREAKAALAFLREAARRRLLAASEGFAGELGHSVSRITLRDTRSRWGSCSSAGHLMYSWRLVLAPPDVLDYVAAHEVAHLQQMDHSPRFWDLVERLKPGWKAQRDWLRREGPDLHRFRFGN
ncbi:MAG: M48 family metallopeptidase [Alphaproteobacteria bacterium]|nr:M48 family metallopeptidase [Alphaproteobacteria bacterium]NNF23803.1 M48 family metallopeptidase [Paracoccaceae bacterium]